MPRMTIMLAISPYNYHHCVQGHRSFLVVDNKEISIQKGDIVNVAEEEEGASKHSGRYFTATVVFVTNHRQQQNHVVFEFTDLQKGFTNAKS